MSQPAEATSAHFVQPPQSFEEPSCSIVCKTLLIALGVISIIGGAVATGVLFSHLGYPSLGCLGSVPIGIALIILGVRYTIEAKAPSISIQTDPDSDGVLRDLKTELFEGMSHLDKRVVVNELKTYLFETLFNADTIKNCQPLGKQVPIINYFLHDFCKRYGMRLTAMGSMHDSNAKDPWQTIKILDYSIKKVGQESSFLKALNEDLYQNHGLISNGGDSNEVVRGKQKQTPLYFIKNKVPMFPQIQISLIDIRKILNLINEDQYFQELQDAYKGKKSD